MDLLVLRLTRWLLTLDLVQRLGFLEEKLKSKLRLVEPQGTLIVEHMRSTLTLDFTLKVQEQLKWRHYFRLNIRLYFYRALPPRGMTDEERRS